MTVRPEETTGHAPERTGFRRVLVKIE